MNLPFFYELQPNQGTYITFSKALLDFDYARNTDNPYYYTKMVALNLPNYVDPGFIADVTSQGITDLSPNITVPKLMQFYLENLCRQTDEHSITELAFWKMLNHMGLSYDDVKKSVVFINEIATESFTYTENNNGWCEIVCSIPNTTKNLTFDYKELDLPPVLNATEGNTDGIFDNDEKQFLFDTVESKQVIDFETVQYTDGVVEDFDFNVLLMFYTDRHGVQKLHGINFLNDFDNKISHWEVKRYTKISNDYRSLGYQFKLNLKTVNNEATKTLVEQHNFDAAHWNTYLTTLSRMNSILNQNESKDLSEASNIIEQAGDAIAAVNQVISVANNAASNANNAANSVGTAVTDAETATQAANTATTAANTATSNANNAAQTANNARGWTPIFNYDVVDSETTVKQLVDYVGGTGTKPTTNVGQYVTDGGYSSDINQALNFRGTNGLAGTHGWSPVHVFEVDGTRLVKKLSDYIDGTGTKPTTNIGQYVTESGYTTIIGDALDFRGLPSTEVILTSPNNTQFRLIVGDDGSLSTEEI